MSKSLSAAQAAVTSVTPSSAELH